MPGKLNIENNSATQDVIIFLWSADGKEQHLNATTLSGGDTTSAVVKGGVKKLVVAFPNGRVFWEGLIPSYGSAPVMIHPEKSMLTYRGTVLVNTLVGGKTVIPAWTWLIVILILIAITVWYMYKRK